jgi:hypothetical protein
MVSPVASDVARGFVRVVARGGEEVFEGRAAMAGVSVDGKVPIMMVSELEML